MPRNSVPAAAPRRYCSEGGREFMTELAAIEVLRAAIAKVPVVKFGLGVAGVGAGLALARSFMPGVSLPALFPALGAFMLAMVLLIVVARVARTRSHLSAAAVVLVWAVCAFVVIVMIFTVTAIAIGRPRIWASLILPPSALAAVAASEEPTKQAPPQKSPASTPQCQPQGANKQVEELLVRRAETVSAPADCNLRVDVSAFLQRRADKPDFPGTFARIEILGGGLPLTVPCDSGEVRPRAAALAMDAQCNGVVVIPAGKDLNFTTRVTGKYARKGGKPPTVSISY
jgi:hypothetical protein